MKGENGPSDAEVMELIERFDVTVAEAKTLANRT